MYGMEVWILFLNCCFFFLILKVVILFVFFIWVIINLVFLKKGVSNFFFVNLIFLLDRNYLF